MDKPGVTSRTTALLAVGALILHQARYMVGYDDAGDALAAQGHSYLAVAGPLAGLLLALASARLLVALAAGGGRGAPDGGRAPSSFGARWFGAAAALAIIYVVQESVEGLLAAGHPAGLDGLLAAGGWSALPLAIAIGAAIALALNGADAAIALARRAPYRARRIRGGSPARPHARDLPSLDVFALNLAGRAPPATSC